ncbi:MAG: methyltransferase domain-containing protein [Pseudomonadota bacterium]|nr:methyltransferase domain-containing protein [Pseudomonadota bacterium]
MFEDASLLHDYYRTPQGRHVAMWLRRALAEFWVRAPNASNAAIGYAPPVLRADDQLQALALMPMRLGPRPWPRKGPGRTALVDSRALPLQNVQLDRLLLIHALEFDPNPSRLLDECWRVLDGSGRLMVMVPNRNGLWARAERTPFGHGRPYSRGQLRHLLQEHGFSPVTARTILFTPPAAPGLFLGMGPQIERLGRNWSPGVGGVLVIEAEKNLYAPAGQTSRQRAVKSAIARKLAPRPSGAIREGTE